MSDLQRYLGNLNSVKHVEDALVFLTKKSVCFFLCVSPLLLINEKCASHFRRKINSLNKQKHWYLNNSFDIKITQLSYLHALQTFSLQQIDGEHMKSRIKSPTFRHRHSAHTGGKMFPGWWVTWNYNAYSPFKDEEYLEDVKNTVTRHSF